MSEFVEIEIFLAINPRNVVDLLVEEFQAYPSTTPTEEEISLKVFIKGKECGTA